ncbi:hypothetical protein ASPWEDRAFT_44512 [Aspergillus wentii DTO 134E9]|uniref:Uncharacterized protein n=1 Tax=Aspergillus wentii DTO 134E9 TaxID=1073089 RepID=A0A1L9RBV9_ASPWE|nr:uncharacterized protein ASPWEDRAFT_44512 [Aspergillus wentii DTO 134E9]OJJ32401.1 hypothetical protein ASPWEDRAFT_44512 [Aspergillus wentii DTO 134E9]
MIILPLHKVVDIPCHIDKDVLPMIQKLQSEVQKRLKEYAKQRGLTRFGTVRGSRRFPSYCPSVSAVPAPAPMRQILMLRVMFWREPVLVVSFACADDPGEQMIAEGRVKDKELLEQNDFDIGWIEGKYPGEIPDGIGDNL